MAKVRVQYKGLSDVREISKKDLKPHNIDIDKDLVWTRERPVLYIDAVDELVAIFKNDGAFTVNEVKDDGSTGDVIVSQTVADDTVNSSTVVDGNTGQKSSNPNPGATPGKDK